MQLSTSSSCWVRYTAALKHLLCLLVLLVVAETHGRMCFAVGAAAAMPTCQALKCGCTCVVVLLQGSTR